MNTRCFTLASLLVALSLTGCSVASTAMGALLPKPQPTVVVNNQNVIGSASLVAQPAPKKSAMEKVGIVTTTTLAGAAVGALVGWGTQHDKAPAAALGAGFGALAGVALARN